MAMAQKKSTSVDNNNNKQASRHSVDYEIIAVLVM